MSNEVEVSMDALLDGTLDDLADIPEFRMYPEGVHKVVIAWNISKTIDGTFNEKDKESSGLKVFVELATKAEETVELPEGSTEAPLTAGMPAQFLFDLKNEFGQGAFKAIMQSLANHYGAKSPRELIKESEGATCLVAIKHTTQKKSGKTYAKIESLAVV